MQDLLTTVENSQRLLHQISERDDQTALIPGVPFGLPDMGNPEGDATVKGSALRCLQRTGHLQGMADR